MSSSRPALTRSLHSYLVQGEKEAINPHSRGTKVAGHYVLDVPGGGEVCIKARLCDKESLPSGSPFGPGFDATFKNRLDEADDFYDGILPSEMLPEQRNVARQAYAGMCVLVARVSFLVLVRAIYEHNSSTLPPILLQVYCGASSSITTLWRHGWTETQISPNLLLRGKRAGTRTGNTSSTVMLSLCPTNGSTHGLARLPLFLCSLHFCV